MMNSYLMNMEAPIGLAVIAVVFFLVFGIGAIIGINRLRREGWRLDDFE